MIYGNVEFKFERGSLTITKKKAQIVRHYPGTNKSDSFPLGKQATTITCSAIAKNDAERILLEQLFHSNEERELHIDNFFYKRVVTGESSQPKKVIRSIWLISVEFIALDPVPYDSTTGEALY